MGTRNTIAIQFVDPTNILKSFHVINLLKSRNSVLNTFYQVPHTKAKHLATYKININEKPFNDYC